MAIATNGERLVGWWSWLPELMVRRLARSGAPLTPELSASGHSEWHSTTSICALPGGRFLAAWQAPFPEEGIFARSIGADDTLGPIHRIDPPGDPLRGRPHLACDRFGGVLAVYVAVDGTVRARQLDLSGAPAGEEVVAGDWSNELVPPPPVAALGPGGRALVAWRSDDATGVGVAGRVLQLGPAACVPSDTDLCLHGGRFRVRAHWRNPNSRDAGLARARPLLDDTGTFWFFAPDNLELAVKVLDGRAVNGRFWVFAGSLTTVEYWLEVFDTATAAARTYYNPPGSQAGIADTGAFVGTAAAAAVSPPAREPAAAFPAGPCAGPPATLCLGGGRFAVEVTWRHRRGDRRRHRRPPDRRHRRLLVLRRPERRAPRQAPRRPPGERPLLGPLGGPDDGGLHLQGHRPRDRRAEGVPPPRRLPARRQRQRGVLRLILRRPTTHSSEASRGRAGTPLDEWLGDFPITLA